MWGKQDIDESMSMQSSRSTQRCWVGSCRQWQRIRQAAGPTLEMNDPSCGPRDT